MGTFVEGALPDVLALMPKCIELVAPSADRVTCTAKLDLRNGRSGRLQAKVDSVEAKVGRKIKRA